MQIRKNIEIGFKYSKSIVLLLSVFLLFNSKGIAQNATNLSQIKNVALASLEAGRKTQEKIDAIDEKRIKLVNEYRATLKQNSSLEKYNAMQRKMLDSKKEEIESLKQQIESVSNLEREIVPLMSDMLETLKYFIALDLPFLKTERTKRVQKLEELLGNGKVSNSEKYRRILEAYQIENDYGRTIEAYDEPLLLDGNPEKKQMVTFFKVGRVAFLYQTLDMSESYIWSKENNEWQRLDNSYNSKISEGIKMAKEQIPSNLMFVPVQAPTLNSQS